MALAVSTAACTGHAGRPRGYVNSLGCYIGPVRLQASPNSAQPGSLVALQATGHWRARHAYDVGTQSWGLLGTAAKGHFAATYNLAAIVPGLQHDQNIPAGPSVALGGIGLRNFGFRVRVPPVHSGKYVIKFTYSVTLEALGRGIRIYNLCAPLNVTS